MRVAMISVLLLVAACGSARSDSRAPRPWSAPLFPTSGCRAPSEAGCASCCDRSELGDGYIVLGSVSRPGDARVYDSMLLAQYEHCPASVRQCAPCRESEERALAALAERPECECRRDAAPQWCADGDDTCRCHCQKLLLLADSCPHVVHPDVSRLNARGKLELKW